MSGIGRSLPLLGLEERTTPGRWDLRSTVRPRGRQRRVHGRSGPRDTVATWANLRPGDPGKSATEARWPQGSRIRISHGGGGRLLARAFADDHNVNEHDPKWVPIDDRTRQGRAASPDVSAYGLTAECPKCHFRVQVLADGRLCSHYVDGKPVVGGRQAGKCSGTHMKSEPQTYQHAQSRQVAAPTNRNRAFKWIALAEFLVLVGACIRTVTLFLSDSDADHSKAIGPLWLAVGTAVMFVITLLMWVNRAIPGSAAVIGGAVAAGVVAHTAVEHRHKEEEERIERAVSEALRKRDRKT